MTALLEQAIATARLLSEEQQSTIATMILEQIRNERTWQQAFAATSDDEWDKMAEAVRKEIVDGKISSLDDFLKDSPANTSE